MIVRAGSENESYQQALSEEYLTTLSNNLREAGAKAAIILWHYQGMPWDRVQRWLKRESLIQGKPDNKSFPYFYLNATQSTNFEEVDGQNIRIDYPGREVRILKSYNVLGYLEGTATDARENYLLLSAHYDHVGGVKTENGEDKIYNGARDNAVGTASVMMAADYFADNRPEHSVLFAAWTAEEIGLLGSRYFVENSPVEMNKIIYNLNIDNAGYNDTTKVTVIGLDRTMAEKAITGASLEFGLTAITDPAPEQNLFDRSDNVNFARLGIPAPTFSLGFTAFDQEIAKYYHNVADEADSLNFSYVTKYTRAFILAAQKIANRETETFWKPGDKYEESGKLLYNR